MFKKIMLAAAALAGGAVAVLAVFSLFASNNYNILIVTMDTQRADRLGCYGHDGGLTPVADRLASEGVLFENAFAPVPMTLPSHSSLFTGFYPVSHGVRENTISALDSRFTTLAEILSEKGYKTAAVPAAIVVNSEKGLAQGFEFYDDNLDSAGVHEGLPDAPYRRGEVVADIALKWLKARPEGNFFMWAHFFDPHIPYNAPEPFASEHSDPYNAEVAYADHCLGKVIKYLESEKLLEKTIIVYLGDHGESLGEHGEETHGYFAYDSALRVPMIIRMPDGSFGGTRSRLNVSIVDILPTVLELAGFDKLTPEGTEGISLLPLMKGETVDRDVIFFEAMQAYIALGWSGLAGCISGDDKYIRTDIEELYDLESDRAESENLSVAEERKAASMRQSVERDYLSRKPFFLADAAGMTAEDQAQLASLGYLGGGVSGATDNVSALFSGPGLIQSRELWDEYFASLVEMRNGNADRAAEMLTGLLGKSDGHNYGILRWLANIASQNGDYDAMLGCLNKLMQIKTGPGIIDEIERTTALRDEINARVSAFENATAGNPCDVFAHIELAKFYAEKSLFAKADEVFENALSTCGEDPKLFNSFGIALSMSGRTDDGIKMFERALEADPGHIEAYMNLAYAHIQKGDYPNAAGYLARAEAIDPFNAKVAELKKLLPVRK